MWARGVSGPSAVDGFGYIIHRSIGAFVGSSVFFLAVEGGGFYAGDVSGIESSATTTIANGSTWRLLTVTYDGVTRRTYVDGDLQSELVKSFTNTTSGSRLTIGGTAYNATYRPFQGAIDDVRLYNRVLPQTEIQTLYNQGAR